MTLLRTGRIGPSRAELFWLTTLLPVLMSPALMAADNVPATPVTVSVAKQVQRPELLNASGAIAAWEDVSVSARVTGLSLTRVLVHVGDRVQKGQLLGQFDEAPVEAEVAQAEAALAQARASAEEAEANHKRALDLEAS